MPALSSTPPVLTTKDIERFWATIDMKLPDECWPSTSYARGGYGLFQHGTKLRGAHRIAHFIATGEWPTYVLHSRKCTTRRCCNPSHLRSGTQSENIADALTVRGSWSKGTHNHFARLTEQQVRQFRELIGTGVTVAEASRTFGISKNAGYHIFHGRTWSWLK